MKNGLVFQVDNQEYVVAFCSQAQSGNAAILLRRSDGCSCFTVSNLKRDGKGNYTWDRGYAAKNYSDAVNNFMARVNA